jgi:hypothetical protein
LRKKAISLGMVLKRMEEIEKIDILGMKKWKNL